MEGARAPFQSYSDRSASRTSTRAARAAGIKEAATAATYAVQRQVYGAALAAITAVTPVRFTFMFAETQAVVGFAEDRATVQTAAEQVRSLIEVAGPLAAGA